MVALRRAGRVRREDRVEITDMERVHWFDPTAARPSGLKGSGACDQKRRTAPVRSPRRVKVTDC